MLKLTRFVALALSVSMSTSLFAQSQVATAVSASPFELRGARVNPSLAVPTWPVMPGDRIKAGNTPVTLTFKDGSTISLAPCAAAVVNLSDTTPVFQLESESANYKLTKLDGVKLVSKDAPVVPQDLVGAMTLGNSCKPAGFWTPTKTALIIAGAAGLAGITVGLVTQNGAAVSPVR